MIVRGERYEFEMKAVREAAYVAVGLSDDDKMGDDSVIECVNQQNQMKAYMSRTTPRNNLNAVRLPRVSFTIISTSAFGISKFPSIVICEPRMYIHMSRYVILIIKYVMTSSLNI